MGQFRQPLAAVSHGNFRRYKILAWLQAPSEHRVVNPHHQPGLVELVYLGMHMEAPAVEQGEPIASPHIFIGIFICKDDKWVMLMAGGPPGAS